MTALLGELRMRSLQNVYLPVTIRLQEATNITGVSLRWAVGAGMEVRGCKLTVVRTRGPDGWDWTEKEGRMDLISA